MHGQLEHRIGAPRVSVVAVLVAGRDHQHAKADDRVQTMHDLARRTRILDAGSEALRDAEAVLPFTQGEQTAIGAETRGIEPGDDPLAADR